MSRKAWPIIVLVLLSVCLNVVQPASAAPFQAGTVSRQVSFTDLGYDRDETLKGVLAARDYSVRWPDAWQVEPGNLLRLVFSHMPALHPTSSLAVDWNGTRLASVLLSPENAGQAVLEIPIPENLILTGYNSLHVEFYMGIQDDFCADEDNPALWGTIHSSSAFSFAYSTPAPAADLSRYPQPLIDNSPLVENQVTFVLPHNPSAAEINAAAVISAHLGQLAAWRPLAIDVVAEPASLEALNGKGDLILVGSPDRLKLLAALDMPMDSAQPARFWSQNGQPVPAGAGVIWQQVSPADEAATLLAISGENPEAVLLAARALGSSSTYPRFSGPMGVVLDMPTSSDLPSLTPGKFTLEQLGYADIVGEGSREQSINYALRLPGTWQSQADVVFDLHFGHSEILNDKRSSLTVKVNDVPVGSLPLTKDNASNGKASFNIPARLFKAGANKLTISGNLTLPDAYVEGSYCLDRDYRDAWLVIYADSQLNLPGGPSGFFVSLTDYPSAFTGAADLSELAFVVPTQPGIEIAKSVAWIAAGLGQSSEGPVLFPHVVDTQELYSLETPYKRLILVGTPTQNAAISQYNDRLPLPFEAGTDQPQSIEGVSQTLPLGGSAGYLQAFTGPDEMPILVVTGSSDQGVLWGAGALNDPNLLSTLKGNLAVLDGQSSLTAMETRSRFNPVFVSETEIQLQPGISWKLTSWVVEVAGLIFLLAVIALVVYIWTGYRKNQQSEPGFDSHSI